MLSLKKKPFIVTLKEYLVRPLAALASPGYQLDETRPE
jgi:hypothetical protein